jgi:hypothetical protein
MKIYYGKCAGCGKKGIISVSPEKGEGYDEVNATPDEKWLVSFGSLLFCCDDKCYENAKESKNVPY